MRDLTDAVYRLKESSHHGLRCEEHYVSFHMKIALHLLDKMKLMRRRFPSIGHIEVAYETKDEIREFPFAWCALTPVLALFTNLTSISFEMSEVSDDVIINIAKKCRKITKARLYNTRIGNAAVSALAEHCELEYLAIGATDITDDSLRSLAQCPKLWFLDVDNTLVTDEGFKCLATACKNISVLHMMGASIECFDDHDISMFPLITDKCAEHIALFRDLRTLDVLWCIISADFLITVGMSCPKLSWLKFSDPNDPLLASIVPHFPYLIRLDLGSYEEALLLDPLHSLLTRGMSECDFISIEGLRCLEGCHRLRDVEFHIKWLPRQRVPISVREKSEVIQAFKSFANAKLDEAQDKALTSDCISRAYAQFDADLADLYEDKKTIRL